MIEVSINWGKISPPAVSRAHEDPYCPGANRAHALACGLTHARFRTQTPKVRVLRHMQHPHPPHGPGAYPLRPRAYVLPDMSKCLALTRRCVWRNYAHTPNRPRADLFILSRGSGDRSVPIPLNGPHDHEARPDLQHPHKSCRGLQSCG